MSSGLAGISSSLRLSKATALLRLASDARIASHLAKSFLWAALISAILSSSLGVRPDAPFVFCFSSCSCISPIFFLQSPRNSASSFFSCAIFLIRASSAFARFTSSGVLSLLLSFSFSFKHRSLWASWVFSSASATSAARTAAAVTPCCLERRCCSAANCFSSESFCFCMLACRVASPSACTSSWLYLRNAARCSSDLRPMICAALERDTLPSSSPSCAMPDASSASCAFMRLSSARGGGLSRLSPFTPAANGDAPSLGLGASLPRDS
mmetsp:Transcript_11308/g.21420  ORF Transcript_11308/g.21420 Transcript_11308/m.21420 type:complete len:268 (-) Transcript_11308:722-1525(-)